MDTPILDYPALALDCLKAVLWAAFFAYCYRRTRRAVLAEASKAQQAEWTAHLDPCGLCHNRRRLTSTTVTFLDDINHHIRDAYTLRLCSDCADAITSQDRSKAA